MPSALTPFPLRRHTLMPGRWFIREGIERDTAPGQWEVWFRPVRGAERRHGNFPTQEQAVEVANLLNELGRRVPAIPQGDGDPKPLEAEQEHA